MTTPKTEPQVKAAHTPGPWNVESNHVFDASGYCVAICPYTKIRPQAEANARLIAAAPKLLAALKRLHAAEDMTIETFTAKEIDELEAAMKQAGEAIQEAEQK